MKEALLYKKLEGEKVQCLLCAHRCVISRGKKGVCQVRENRAGSLFTLVYGQTISESVDPVEKKPLYHFYPGSRSFSLATPGCNFRCDWCQNWQISQQPRERHLMTGHELPPADIVAAAHRTGSHSIAYTYTEPTIFFEYSYATAKLAREAGIANIYVSNGYMSAEMMALFHPLLDAVNIDLKAFRDATYRNYVGARLQPVLDTLKRVSDDGTWLEVTTLVIPGVNDDEDELREIAKFMVTELGADTPWHVSRFYPQYKMAQTLPTPPATIQKAVEIGRAAGLKHVYPGNLGGQIDTNCPVCNGLLIRRDRFGVNNQINSRGCCPACGEIIAGAGMNYVPPDRKEE